MEDQVYETATLNADQTKDFKSFLDKEIGTEYEVNEYSVFTANDEIYYITVFDLTPGEVDTIRGFENAMSEEV